MGEAVRIGVASRAEDHKRVSTLRNRLQELLIEGVSDIVINGPPLKVAIT